MKIQYEKPFIEDMIAIGVRSCNAHGNGTPEGADCNGNGNGTGEGM